MKQRPGLFSVETATVIVTPIIFREAAIVNTPPYGMAILIGMGIINETNAVWGIAFGVGCGICLGWLLRGKLRPARAMNGVLQGVRNCFIGNQLSDNEVLL